MKLIQVDVRSSSFHQQEIESPEVCEADPKNDENNSLAAGLDFARELDIVLEQVKIGGSLPHISVLGLQQQHDHKVVAS